MGMIESLRKEIVSIINLLGIFISSFGGPILTKNVAESPWHFLVGGFKYVLLSPLFGEDSHFD